MINGGKLATVQIQVEPRKVLASSKKQAEQARVEAADTVGLVALVDPSCGPNRMRGVKRGFGMLFTPRGRLTRHIRAPTHQRQA